MRISAPCRWPALQWRQGWSTSPRHSGVDFGWRVAPNTAKSKEILAAGPGIVESVTDSGAHNQGWGNRIIIRHTNRATTTYSHNQSGTAKVKKGQRVDRGQVVATQGATGDARGVHLHFEVYIDGVRVDPQPYLDGRALPGTPLVTDKPAPAPPPPAPVDKPINDTHDDVELPTGERFVLTAEQLLELTRIVEVDDERRPPVPDWLARAAYWTAGGVIVVAPLVFGQLAIGGVIGGEAALQQIAIWEAAAGSLAALAGVARFKRVKS